MQRLTFNERTMDENNYIECRKDVRENILTLYSYLQNKEEEYYYEWAKERLSQGRNFVVEAIDGKLYFAPSRFVGYKQNSLEKHEDNSDKSGTDTDRELKRFYKLIDVESALDDYFIETLAQYGKTKTSWKFWIPKDSNIEEILSSLNNTNTRAKDMNDYSNYISLLQKNYNLILNGAPGTGKTYLAKHIAAHIIFDGNVPENFEEHPKFIEQCSFVQFHPSYDYTDFVEGLRPTRPNQDGNIGFERKDGIFKAFCKKAASQDTNISIKPQVNLELVRKTDDNPTSFMEVYQKLVNDIRSGNAVLYSDFRSKMTTIKLRVDRINGIDIIKFWKTKDFQNAQYDYLKRIYDYYYSRGIFDIRDKRFEDFVKIIGNTLDYSYYRGIVQGLLDRTDRGATTKVPLSNLHVDRDKDYNVDLSPQPYIFIIDEINRGEISKIFGELFFSVAPGYRGVKGKVQTQYQNLITEDDPFKDGFYIPENVYIIGTMNDIDRSVECMDFAMRRRFTFKEITAEESGINMGLSGEAIKRMQSLNKAISEVDGFNSSFHIGAAYYLGVTDYNELWELKLQGLLKEYLRGMPDAEETLDTLKKAYELSSQDDNN